MGNGKEYEMCAHDFILYENQHHSLKISNQLYDSQFRLSNHQTNGYIITNSIDTSNLKLWDNWYKSCKCC